VLRRTCPVLVSSAAGSSTASAAGLAAGAQESLDHAACVSTQQSSGGARRPALHSTVEGTVEELVREDTCWVCAQKRPDRSDCKKSEVMEVVPSASHLHQGLSPLVAALVLQAGHAGQWLPRAAAAAALRTASAVPGHQEPQGGPAATCRRARPARPARFGARARGGPRCLLKGTARQHFGVSRIERAASASALFAAAAQLAG